MNLYGFVGNDGVSRWDVLGLQEKRNCRTLSVSTVTGNIKKSVFGKEVSISGKTSVNIEICDICCDGKFKKGIAGVSGSLEGSLELSVATWGGSINEGGEISGEWWAGAQAFSSLVASGQFGFQGESCNGAGKVKASVQLGGEIGARVGGDGFITIYGAQMGIGVYGEIKAILSGWNFGVACDVNENGISNCEPNIEAGSIGGQVSINLRSGPLLNTYSTSL
jgi:hypothetical protein